MEVEANGNALQTVLALAAALDADDFDGVKRLLDGDVSYTIGGVSHRGPVAVVDSYRNGSATARAIFDDVEFSHSVVGTVGDRTIRVDFGDRLSVNGDVFDHHSVQDITVDSDGLVTHIVDQPVDGQRARLDEFMSRHNLVRPT